MVERIAVIKTGWSDDFQGAEVEGDHRYVRENGYGHEKFNFRRTPDGTFCIYTPPLREETPPNPKHKAGWLVFHLAKRPKRSGLYLVGWYEDAEFLNRYQPRPEYKQRPSRLELDNGGQPYSYIIAAPKAVQLNSLDTPHIFRGDKMKRAPVFYLRGGDKSEGWRDHLAEKLLAIRSQNKKRGEEEMPVGATGNSKGGGVSADPVRRKEVEETAIAMVKAHYPASKYEVTDKQRDNCGYDILVRHRTNRKAEMHIEVKGTQLTQPHFLMSKNEHAYMLGHPEQWRLAMVTDALSDKPKLKLYKADQAKADFNWDVFSWHATAKP